MTMFPTKFYEQMSNKGEDGAPTREGCCFFFGQRFPVTPPKIDMEPKNHPLEKENHLLSFHDYVPC